MAAFIPTATRIVCVLAALGLFCQAVRGQTEGREATASRPKLIRLAHNIVAGGMSCGGLPRFGFQRLRAACSGWRWDDYCPKCPPAICPPRYCGHCGCYRPKCPPLVCLPRYCGTGECYQPKCPPRVPIPCGVPRDGK